MLAKRTPMQVLRRLREETATVPGAHMQVAPDQGQFMAQLAQLLGARTFLEVGTFTGYSSLAVALVLPNKGRVVTLDRDPEPVKIAKKYWGLGDVADIVDCRVGPAAESLIDVEKEYGLASFDLAFIGVQTLRADRYRSRAKY
jgi:O-methyltransferase